MAPLVDLAVVFSLILAIHDLLMHPTQWNHQLLNQTLLYWGAFILVDLSAAALGMAFERDAPWGSLGWLPAQRFGYRQLMYYVVVKAVVTAVHGPEVGWNKLERSATVAMGGVPQRRRTVPGVVAQVTVAQVVMDPVDSLAA